MTNLPKEITFKIIDNNYGEIFTLTEFFSCCENTLFTNEDGSGYFVRDRGGGLDQSNMWIDIKEFITVPIWATLIIWVDKCL